MLDKTFWRIVLFLNVACNTADLVGTYIAQPNFEHEVNPIYQLLTAWGVKVTWPMAIFGKALFVAAVMWFLWLLMRARTAYYPGPGKSYREFVTLFLYGRPLSWLQTMYSLPRQWKPFVLTMGGILAFLFPHPLYLGYDNIAIDRGWPILPSWQLGPVWIDLTLILLAVAVPFWLLWVLWRDYQRMSESVAS